MLLIDEIDTAIHAKYFNDIFQFLVTACSRYDVQLFITTHNIEAVDAILATQNYNEPDSEDYVSVMTMKKGWDRSLCRRHMWKQAYSPIRYVEYTLQDDLFVHF